MDRNGVWRFPEGSGRQGKVNLYCCNVICGTPTTVKVKGQRDERECSALLEMSEIILTCHNPHPTQKVFKFRVATNNNCFHIGGKNVTIYIKGALLHLW